ncbi:MAG: tripartite tricarboxylate transporter TctB family protein [Betaproteobacteria bacterium]|nr:tripartite tricarboxylate transporter TctB family protein [Betaproteobacteria bacterium]
MKVDLRSNKDFLAGLLLIGIGVLGFYMALDYPFGSTLRMGPGYFPRVLAGILIAFGIFTLVRGIVTAEKVKGVWGWKPLTLITASLVAFGWIMDRFGFIPALVAMFFLATLGGHEFKWKEFVILTVVMSLSAIGIFIYGLGMPYQLIQGF